MQEPKRMSLLDYLKKTLAKANRKIYIHRLMYTIRHYATDRVSNENWIKAIDTKIKQYNEDKFEEEITGIGLFYKGYVVNIIEGSENLLNIHMTQITKYVQEKSSNIKISVLIVIPHVYKRYFQYWKGCQVTPPVLLQAIPPAKTPAQFSAKLRECLNKLNQLCERLDAFAYELHRPSTSLELEEMLKSCKTFLPETKVLDFLIDSPLLISGEEFVRKIDRIPEYILYHFLTWPPPPDYVPYNVI